MKFYHKQQLGNEFEDAFISYWPSQKIQDVTGGKAKRTKAVLQVTINFKLFLVRLMIAW
jgi:hypothetical protein